MRRAPPRLWLGSVVTRRNSDKRRYLSWLGGIAVLVAILVMLVCGPGRSVGHWCNPAPPDATCSIPSPTPWPTGRY